MKSPPLYRRPPVRSAEEGGSEAAQGPVSEGAEKAGGGEPGASGRRSGSGDPSARAAAVSNAPPPLAPRGGAESPGAKSQGSGASSPSQSAGDGSAAAEDVEAVVAGAAGAGTRLLHGSRRRSPERPRARFFFFLRHYKDERVPLLQTLGQDAPELEDARRRLAQAVRRSRAGVEEVLSAAFAELGEVVSGRLEQEARRIADVRWRLADCLVAPSL